MDLREVVDYKETYSKDGAENFLKAEAGAITRYFGEGED